MTVIGFVPARGGSARIPRKNLRTVQGIPLVARTIRSLHAAGIADVIVSTDDREIADVARLWGAKVDLRPAALAGNDVTIDQVVYEWLERSQHDEPSRWPLGQQTVIAVAQPTSPLLRPETIADCVDYVKSTGASVFTTTPERGLLWAPSITPMFSLRRNSTSIGEPEYFRETGGLVVFQAANRVAGEPWPPMPQTMSVIHGSEAIDVDEYFDLTRARAGARPARIQLRYVESLELGWGHRMRCETLAAELQGRHVVEVGENSKLPLYDGAEGDRDAPDVVVLDILDTKVEDVQSLYDAGVQFVVTLEDLGNGAHLADLVINELYPSYRTLGNVERFGPRWAVLRPEFQGHPFPARARNAMTTVVVTFGGTDPTNMTERAIEELQAVDGLDRIRVILPPGRPHDGAFVASVAGDPKVEVVHSPVMAREFLTADVAVTAAGRTVHEAAACGVPVVAVPVNERERHHAMCPGVAYTNPNLLRAEVEMWLNDPAGASARAKLAHEAVDGLGAQRIAYLIDGLLSGLL